jgi:NhaA family Na+:H+ antiporter
VNWHNTSVIALPVGAIVAMAWANAFPLAYAQFSHALQFAVNDVAMAFFFALAAKEVVEATAPQGALHTWQRAAMPVLAAAGGMLAPACLYLAAVYTANEPILARGWAIPCATDIAFSYVVARAIYGEAPAVPFLLLLAIADDALGLVILALFYPVGSLHLGVGIALFIAALGAAFALRRTRVVAFWPYLAGAGALSWAAFFMAGLHPALALVPIVPFMPHAARDPGLFVDAPPNARDTLSRFEHAMKLPVQATLLLFGLVNAGVRVQEFGTGTWAVFASMLVGKPLGIALAVGAATLAGFKLPPRLHARDLLVVGLVAAIGFTVALFFATAAYPIGPVLNEVKLGALMSVGSAVVAIAAARLLRVGRFSAVPPRAA